MASILVFAILKHFVPKKVNFPEGMGFFFIISGEVEGGGGYCFRAIFYALYTIILPVSTIFYDGKHLGQKKKLPKTVKKT